MTLGHTDREEVQRPNSGSSKVDRGGADTELGENPECGVLEHCLYRVSQRMAAASSTLSEAESSCEMKNEN